LLIVSDLTQITNKQIEVLKRVLGRDTLSVQKKYESEFGVISPYCQILFISNFPPSHFYLFNQDQAIMDKLIKAYLGPKLQISATDQVANIGSLLDPFVVDILNWAVHTPQPLLRYFIRAIELNMIFESEVGGSELKAVPGFINACVYKASSTSFTTSADLETAYLSYLDSSGEGSIKFDKDRTESTFGSILSQSFATIFGESYNQVKYRSNYDEQGNRIIRKQGFYGIKCTNGQKSVDKERFKGFEPIIRASTRELQLENPFTCDNVIAWSGDSNLVEMESIQQRILQKRREGSQPSIDIESDILPSGTEKPVTSLEHIKLLADNKSKTEPFELE